MSRSLRTPSSRFVRALAIFTAGILATACGARAGDPSPVPPNGQTPSGSATIPPLSTPPSPAITPGATPRPVVADGEAWIVFQSLADEFDSSVDQDGIDHDDTVFLVRPDGSGLHRLVPEDFVGSEIRPTWAPDGSRIAFIRARLPDDSGELWAIDVDGSDPEMLYRCQGPEAADSDCNSFSYPDWAPDGAIYFDHDSDPPADGGPPETFQMWRYSFETGSADPVLTNHDRTVEQTRVSPDASKAVYSSFRNIESATPEAALFVVDLATGDDHRITDWDLFPAYPDWSINDVIAFNSYDLRLFPDVPVASNLYTVDPDGTHLAALTNLDEQGIRSTQPRWMSDGNGFVYTRVTPDPGDPFGDRHIWQMEADGSNPHVIAGGLVGTHPEPRPVP